MKKIKIAFLDRDGVLNSSEKNRGYIGFIKDFRWISVGSGVQSIHMDWT